MATRTASRRRASEHAAAHAAVVREFVALPAPVRAQALADVVQTMPTAQLVAVLSGGVDVEAVLRKSLADRGLNIHGEWVGFARADDLFAEWVGPNGRGAHQGTGL